MLNKGMVGRLVVYACLICRSLGMCSLESLPLLTLVLPVQIEQQIVIPVVRQGLDLSGVKVVSIEKEIEDEEELKKSKVNDIKQGVSCTTKNSKLIPICAGQMK